MKHIKPEQILIGLAVIIGGLWVLSALQPPVPQSRTTGASPIAGGSGVGQSGALGSAIGSLVASLRGAAATSSNQGSVVSPGTSFQPGTVDTTDYTGL